jgi:hypothetical protein
MSGRNPQSRIEWSTMRDDAKVTVAFVEATESGSFIPVAVTVERLDGGPVRGRDLLDAARGYDTERRPDGSVEYLGIIDEFVEATAAARSRMVEHRVRVDEMDGLTDSDRTFAAAEDMETVSVWVGPHPGLAHLDTRMSRPRKRVRLTREVLQDVATTVELHPDDWADVLMARFGWTSREHAWRVKGRAVAEGLLPPVEDGRGRKTGGK